MSFLGPGPWIIPLSPNIIHRELCRLLAVKDGVDFAEIYLSREDLKPVAREIFEKNPLIQIDDVADNLPEGFYGR